MVFIVTLYLLQEFEFVNYDLENIVTPVNVQRYKELLYQSNYDLDEAAYLIEVFTKGLELGYEGPEDCT